MKGNVVLIRTLLSSYGPAWALPDGFTIKLARSSPFMAVPSIKAFRLGCRNTAVTTRSGLSGDELRASRPDMFISLSSALVACDVVAGIH